MPDAYRASSLVGALYGSIHNPVCNIPTTNGTCTPHAASAAAHVMPSFGRLIRKAARGNDRNRLAIALIDDIARPIGTKHMHVFRKLVAQTRPRCIRVMVARDEIYGDLRIT